MKVRRVVAGLRPQRRPRGDLEDIVELARSMEAELLGLFIEDIELLHFAALPFAREVGGATAMRREVDVAAMERFMRSCAEELRSGIAEALGGAPLSWSFRVARGTIPGQLLAAGIEQPGPTLLLPPGADIDEEPLVVPADELTEESLQQLLQGARPILILPAGGTAA